MTEIVTIPDGEAVPGNGAYRCSMNNYHGQLICPGPSISSGGLRKIVNESPWHFWASSELNPGRYPDDKEESAALILGKAAHCLILGDEVFESSFIYVPGDAPPRPTSTQIAAFKRDGKWSEAAVSRAEFWEDFDARAAGRSMLTDTQVQKVIYMAENLRKNTLATEVLTGGLTEISMIWRDEATGVWLKSRPDVIPDAAADFGDLKTYAPRTKSIKRAIHQAITDNGYVLQMSLAQMGSEAVFGQAATECVLVMAQSTEPYTVSVVRLDEDTLYWGRCLIRQGIDTFAECMKSGHWPQPVEGVMDYAYPDSFLARLSEMQAAGELPNV